MPSLPQDLPDAHLPRRPQFKGPPWQVLNLQSQDGCKKEQRKISRGFEAGQEIDVPEKTGPYKGIQRLHQGEK